MLGRENPIIQSTKTLPTPSLKCTPDNDHNVTTNASIITDSPFEELIDQSEFLPVAFLEEGATIQKAVARVAIPTNDGIKYGTGFLISPSLFITNNHVLDTKEAAAATWFQFNYQVDLNGNPLPVDVFRADPNFFYTNPKSDLDFTILKLTKNSASVYPGDKYGFIRLITTPFAKDQLCNIIQHPEHRRKEVVLHENRLTDIYEKVIRYKTDTQAGSSGSPVFDKKWDLIALHHAYGEAYSDTYGKIIYVNNEGIRIDKVILHLQNNLRIIPNGSQILAELGLANPS